MFRESGQILEAAIVPLVLLALSGLGVLMTERAIRVAVWVSVVQLGIFALLAARRTELAWWKQHLGFRHGESGFSTRRVRVFGSVPTPA